LFYQPVTLQTTIFFGQSPDQEMLQYATNFLKLEYATFST